MIASAFHRVKYNIELTRQIRRECGANQLADVSSLAVSAFSLAGSPLARTPEIICRTLPHADAVGDFELDLVVIDHFCHLADKAAGSHNRVTAADILHELGMILHLLLLRAQNQEYMMTKISANGSRDINMLLASPPAAAWANAGVISIRTILGKDGKEPASAGAGPVRVKFARNYSGRGPNCNAATPSFRPLARPAKAR